jgi:hypothetical protein
VPQRSLSEMANEQLGVKSRDRLAEGVQGSGLIDCAKDATAQGADNKIGDTANTAGLMNIGPLLKRTIEEKCRK